MGKIIPQKYQEVKGDLIQLALEGNFDVITHGCNCMCQMKAGIAPQKEKYTAKYLDREYSGGFNSAIEALHFLIKSKGVHLFKNPIKLPTWSILKEPRILYKERIEYSQAESKTFYNPMIFIKIK